MQEGKRPNPGLAREIREQGVDIADFGWNLENWDYWARKSQEDKLNLYRLVMVTGYFMEEEKMHPGMKELVEYAEHFVK